MPRHIIDRSYELDALLAKSTAVLAFSVGVPLVLLPLFYLYIDVSIFCAALSAGNFLFHKAYEGLNLEISDPGLLAIEWLASIGEDISPHFVRRAMLFLWAPLFGSGLVVLELLISCWDHLDYHQHPYYFLVLCLSSLISLYCLAVTGNGVIHNGRVRDKSVDLKRHRLHG